MNIDKSDSTMIAVIMSGLPEAYNMVKTSLSGSSKLQTLTLDELETDIRNFYRTNIKKAKKPTHLEKRTRNQVKMMTRQCRQVLDRETSPSLNVFTVGGKDTAVQSVFTIPTVQTTVEMQGMAMVEVTTTPIPPRVTAMGGRAVITME